MADSAFQTMYRKEAIAGFEVRTSALRQATVTEANFSGNSAIFLVASSGSASYTTRGVNGLIPARADSLTQNTCTMTEKHDLVRKTGFNVLNSQGDQRRIMQDTTMGTISRAIDNEILTALSASTTTISTAQTMSFDLVQRAKAKLGNAYVPVEEIDNMFAVVSPAAMAYIEQAPEFSSNDYIMTQPLVGPSRRQLRWAGFNWIVSSLISGIGTSAEYVYFFHRNAIGSAVNKDGIEAMADYDKEQDYSWARATVYSGAKLLQTTGAVKCTHDGSAYA